MSDELVQKYELVLIVDAKKTDSEKDQILKETLDIIGKFKGKVINNHVWFEKQKFTFEIKKITEGTYYIINFEAPGSAVDKIRGSLRLREDVVRFSVLKVESHSVQEPVKAA